MMLRYVGRFEEAAAIEHAVFVTLESGVLTGDVVGYAGSTGRATGDHVHYEVLVYGRQLNPLQFLVNGAHP